jgi:CDP-diacylglycerol pyrophosphatase
MAAMRSLLLWIALGLPSALSGQLIECHCDASRPETLQARPCSLCVEAEKQPPETVVFFLKDINPRKPNRWLALPRVHGTTMHALSKLDPKLQTTLWTAAIEKGRQLWGDRWGLAYNGDLVRTQCHTHIHIGRLLPGIETDRFVVVDGAEQIQTPDKGGIWVHPADGKLHVHTGEEITETVLLR